MDIVYIGEGTKRNSEKVRKDMEIPKARQDKATHSQAGQGTAEPSTTITIPTTTATAIRYKSKRVVAGRHRKPTSDLCRAPSRLFTS